MVGPDRAGCDPRARFGEEEVVGHFNRFKIESGVKNQQPTTQLEVKTLLNRIQHFVGFVYQSICLRGSDGALRIEVKIQPHRGLRGKCSTCQQACPGYDRLPERRWLFVPLWGLVVAATGFPVYAAWRRLVPAAPAS